MLAKTFSDIIVWQKAHLLTLAVYEATKNYPSHELYGLVSQMRRSAISIPSNIAEGFRRNGSQERVRFYNIAQGSLEELKYQILLSKDLKYIASDLYQEQLNMCDEVGKLLYSWIKAIKH